MYMAPHDSIVIEVDGGGGLGKSRFERSISKEDTKC
jgi:hypothetical protein